MIIYMNDFFSSFQDDCISEEGGVKSYDVVKRNQTIEASFDPLWARLICYTVQVEVVEENWMQKL